MKGTGPVSWTWTRQWADQGKQGPRTGSPRAPRRTNHLADQGTGRRPPARRRKGREGDQHPRTAVGRCPAISAQESWRTPAKARRPRAGPKWQAARRRRRRQRRCRPRSRGRTPRQASPAAARWSVLASWIAHGTSAPPRAARPARRAHAANSQQAMGAGHSLTAAHRGRHALAQNSRRVLHGSFCFGQASWSE